MKNILLCSVLLLFSCSKGSLEEKSVLEVVNEQPSYVLEGYKVSQTVASKIALDVYAIFSPATKTGNMGIRDNVPVVGFLDGKIGIDTLMYLVNYTDNQGYAMVSSDVRSGEIIAFVDKGNFSIQDTANNELQKLLVDLMINYQKERFRVLDSLDNATSPITKGAEGSTGGSGGGSTSPKSVITAGGQPVGPLCSYVSRNRPRDYDFGTPKPPPSKAEQLGYDVYYPKYGCTMPLEEYTTPYDKNIGPLLMTNWHQKLPFNAFAEMKKGQRTLAGCVATAVAQIIAYHNYPTTFPSIYPNDPTYMSTLRTISYDSSFDNQPQHIKDAVAKLFRAIGDHLGNDWGLDGTSASDKKVIPCLQAMSYPISGLVLEDYDHTKVIASLNGYKPVYITAYRDWWHTKGHAWVVDGYKILKRTARYWNYRFDENGYYNGRTLLMQQELITDNLMHCNFGWGDDNNTWYASGIFNPTLDVEGMVEYKYKVEIIANIKK